MYFDYSLDVFGNGILPFILHDGDIKNNSISLYQFRFNKVLTEFHLYEDSIDIVLNIVWWINWNSKEIKKENHRCIYYY